MHAQIPSHENVLVNRKQSNDAWEHTKGIPSSIKTSRTAHTFSGSVVQKTVPNDIYEYVSSPRKLHQCSCTLTYTTEFSPCLTNASSRKFSTSVGTLSSPMAMAEVTGGASGPKANTGLSPSHPFHAAMPLGSREYDVFRMTPSHSLNNL